jgi:hypothetical protein
MKEDKSGGDRIRTCDLEVMSLASYLAAPPRVRSSIITHRLAVGKDLNYWLNAEDIAAPEALVAE